MALYYCMLLKSSRCFDQPRTLGELLEPVALSDTTLARKCILPSLLPGDNDAMREPIVSGSGRAYGLSSILLSL